MKKTIASVLFFILTSVSPWAFADTPGNAVEQQCSANDINYNQAVTFVSKLQQAVKNNDKQALAKMMGYSVRINKSPKHFSIKTQQDFINKYPIVFTKVVQSKLIKTNPTDIFCNYQGAMIADGTIWFKGSPLSIFSIND